MNDVNVQGSAQQDVQQSVQQQKGKRRKGFLLVLVLLLMFVSIGYAILSTNLNITGTSTISDTNWDIHFENLNVTTGSVAIGTGDSAATINTATRTDISYTITLNKPGDFYEFTVDVKNSGTVDGMVDTIVSQMNGIDIDALPSYLNYTATYSDGKSIAPNHLLVAGGKETYKVRVEYKKDISSTDLPATDDHLSFTLSVNYAQANENAVDRNAARYVYRNNTNVVDAGADLSELGTTYNTYNALVSATGKNYFLRHKLEGTQVVESSVGFVRGGNVYYLIGGGSVYDPINDVLTSPFYSDNKATMTTAFGAANCVEDSGFYDCATSDMAASAAEDGGVDVWNPANTSSICDVGPDDSSYCS